MSRFHKIEVALGIVALVERQETHDDRGSFGRLFCQDDMKSFGWNKSVAQVNVSRTTTAGSVRGLHYQLPPHAEIKYVSCLKGAIFDVAVDLRRHSPTFLQWCGFELSVENRRGLIIPEGFAHGFQALTSDVEMLYVHSAAYAKQADSGLNVLDSRLAIGWPLPISGLSDKDAKAAMVTESFGGIEL
jgi:dTDP-4-dehydrorhamnose 3,5-epimerase